MQSYGPFWPILAILSQIYALFDVLFTGLNNVAMYQNLQLWDMGEDWDIFCNDPPNDEALAITDIQVSIDTDLWLRYTAVREPVKNVLADFVR